MSGPGPFPVLSALPADDFATTPYLLGEWPGIRSKLNDLGILVSLTGVNEAVMNLSGGLRQNAQEAGQVALQAQFDLQKSLGLTGASVLMTLVDRWGRDAATDAGSPRFSCSTKSTGAETYSAWSNWPGVRKSCSATGSKIAAGRLAFGDEVFSFPCDFINLTFCPGQAGNLVGDYIYNWPVEPVGRGRATQFWVPGLFQGYHLHSNPASI